jgi:hypothetical protein
MRDIGVCSSHLAKTVGVHCFESCKFRPDREAYNKEQIAPVGVAVISTEAQA